MEVVLLQLESTRIKPVLDVLVAGVALLFSICFLMTVWMSFSVPIYPDELAWKLIGSRLFVDGGKLLYFFPQCNTGQWLDIPITWYPARLIDTLIYQNASKSWLLRDIGFSLYILLLICWTYILHFTSRISIIYSGLFVTSFFSFGVLPFLMVFNRPEQSILIWITLSLLLMLWFETHKLSTFLGKFLLTVAFALLACLTAATHPKGIFFFPVLFIAWWRSTKCLPLGFLLIFVMAWTAFETSIVWHMRTACPDVPWLAKTLQAVSLQPQQFFHDTKLFLDLGAANLLVMWDYVRGVEFQSEYQSVWLPPTPLLINTQTDANLINKFSGFPLIMGALLALYNLGEQLRKRKFASILLPATLILSLFFLIFFQSTKNFYEAGIIYPLVLLIFIFSFSQISRISKRLLISAVLPLMLIFGTISSFTRYELFWHHGHTWMANRINASVNDEMLEQFAVNQCGISAQSENLILSLDTYYAFWQHRQPMFLSFITGWWATGSDYVNTIANNHPGGAITTCFDVPSGLKAVMKKDGKGFCCASAEDLKKFSHSKILH